MPQDQLLKADDQNVALHRDDDKKSTVPGYQSISPFPAYEAAQRSGKIITAHDQEWVDVYNYLEDLSKQSPFIAASSALEAIKFISPENENYQTVWSLFHRNIETLTERGKTDEVLQLTRRAISIDIAPPPEPEESKPVKVEKGRDEFKPDKSKLDDQGIIERASKIVRQRFNEMASQPVPAPAHKETPVLSGEETIKRIDGQQQATLPNEERAVDGQPVRTNPPEQKNEEQRQEPRQETPEPQQPGPVPLGNKQILWDYYMDSIDHMAQIDLPFAARHAVDLMLGPAGPDEPWLDILKHKTAELLIGLQDPNAPNAYRNMAASHDLVTRLWNQLPDQDPFRRQVQELAATGVIPLHDRTTDFREADGMNLTNNAAAIARPQPR